MSPLEAAGCPIYMTDARIEESLPGEPTKMRRVCWARNTAIVLVAIAPLTLAPRVRARPAAKPRRSGRNQGRFARPGPTIPIQAIDDEYNRQSLELARRRLEQLARLAPGQKPADAAATYERLFRLAIADDLFRDAEAAARHVVEHGTPSADDQCAGPSRQDHRRDRPRGV